MPFDQEFAGWRPRQRRRTIKGAGKQVTHFSNLRVAAKVGTGFAAVGVLLLAITPVSTRPTRRFTTITASRGKPTRSGTCKAPCWRPGST
jgi:hypothetical protein